MAGSPTHWRGWTCECLHGKWMASQEPTWTARLPPPPKKSSLWRFLFEGLMQNFKFFVDTLWNYFLYLWFVRSQSRPLVAQCSDHCLKCPENAAQQCDTRTMRWKCFFVDNWIEMIYLPRASVISMRKKRADQTFHKNISNIATFYDEESVMGYWSVRN